MLTDAGSVRFQIENYGREQMLRIRDAWPEIKRCLDLASQLLEQYGLTAANLNARSVIHPLAYYFKHRKLDASYLTAKGHEEDHEWVRQWVLRGLLRQGIWGSGLDTLLTRLRTAIKDHGANDFPVTEIEMRMAELGKSLAFDEDAVQALLNLRYGDCNCFALLSLIYPTIGPLRHHVDHVYPQTGFTKTKLRAAGFSDDQIAWYATAAQQVPNLQLLTPAENESKGGQPPASWLAAAFPNEGDRAAVRALHHLGEFGDSLELFEAFFAARREKLASVIRARLGVQEPAGSAIAA